MRLCDPHVHMVSRVTDDYEKMALAGIEVVVEPSFWLGEPRKHVGTFLDYFDHLVHFERERAARYGIRHYCAVSVNPREANNVKLAREVLKKMVPYLKNPSVVAVGEIGFDDITPSEEAFYIEQLEIAAHHRLPVLIHTPHKRKYEGTKRNIDILKKMKYDMRRVLVDHNTEETIGMARASGAWCGHTVYPVTKLSPERAAGIVMRHGVERMMINSSADWGPSDPLSVPRTLLELKRQGMSRRDLETLAWGNPIAFYAQSGKIVEEKKAKVEKS